MAKWKKWSLFPNNKNPKISLLGKFKYWDLERDPNKLSQPVTEKNLNSTHYTKEVTRLTRQKWIEINERIRKQKLIVAGVFSLISLIVGLILGNVFNFQIIPQLLLFFGFMAIIGCLNILVWFWWFAKKDQTYQKMKKEKTNEPSDTSKGTGYFLTDERLPHKSKPWEAQKHFALMAQLSEGMWITRCEIVPNHKKALFEWLDEIGQNFIFDSIRSPSLNDFWKKIIHQSVDDAGQIPIPYTCANDVIRKIQNYLSVVGTGKSIKYGIATSQKEFNQQVYQFCFQKSNLKAFRYQTGYDKEIGSDQPNALVIGMTGSGKTQTLNIPTILANANGVFQPSMVILDPKGELQLKYAPWLKNAGYDVFSINVFNPNASQSWNPIEELYRIALTLAILKELEKQVINHQRFFASTFNETTQEVIQEQPVRDFRLKNLNLGQVGSIICDPLSAKEYLLLKAKYKRLKITKDNFQFDPAPFATNTTFLNSPYLQPQFISVNDPLIGSLYCAYHNVESLYKEEVEPVSAIEHDIDLQRKELVRSIKRNRKQKVEYFELNQEVGKTKTVIPTCAPCAPFLNGQKQVLVFDNFVFYTLDHIPTYISTTKTARDNYLSVLTNALIPVEKGSDSHWPKKGQAFLRGILLRMSSYVEDYPHLIPAEKFNFSSAHKMLNSSDFKTDQVFQEYLFLETLNRKLVELVQNGATNITIEATNTTPKKTTFSHNTTSTTAIQILNHLSPYQIALLKKRIVEVIDSREDYTLLKAFISNEAQANPGELASIRSQVEKTFDALMSEGGKKFTTFNSISISQMINSPKPVIAFVSFAIQEPTYHDYLILFLSTLAQKLSEKAKRSGGTLKRKWMFMMDEFGNLPRFPFLSEILATCRSEGIKWMIILQDYSQLQSKYDQLSDAIESNCPFKIFIKTDNKQTTRKFVESIAQTTIITEEDYGENKKRKVPVSYQLISSESLEALHSPIWNECLIATASYKMIISAPAAYRVLDLSLFNKFPQLDYQSQNYNEDLNLLSVTELAQIDKQACQTNYLKLIQIVPDEPGSDADLAQISADLTKNNELDLFKKTVDDNLEKMWAYHENYILVDNAQMEDLSWKEERYYIGDIIKEVYGLQFNIKSGKKQAEFERAAIALGTQIKLRSFLNGFDVFFGTQFAFSEATFDTKIKDILQGKKLDQWIDLAAIQDYVYGFNDHELNDALAAYALQIIENDWSLEQIKQELHPNTHLEELFRRVFVVIHECFAFELQRAHSEQPKINHFLAKQAEIVWDEEIKFYNIIIGFVDQFILAQSKLLKTTNNFKQVPKSQFFTLQTFKDYIRQRLHLYIDFQDSEHLKVQSDEEQRKQALQPYWLYIEQFEIELNQFFLKNALVLYNELIF